MTNPSEALAEVVRQHHLLRARMDECEELADRIDAGRGDVGALVRHIAALREAFEAHNQFEEQVLRPILRTVDRSGDVHIDHLCADHIDEHRALRHRLDGPAGELYGALYQLRAHLAAEERYFLSASRGEHAVDVLVDPRLVDVL